MSERTARAEKTVLSRQEIATRRKALAEKKAKRGEGGAEAGPGRKALVGLFLLALSVLSLVSVATYSIKDRKGPGFQNAVGPMGHLIAEHLRGLLGFWAYLLPLCAGLYAAMIVFVGSKERRRWPQLVALVLLTLSGAVLAQLFIGNQPGQAHPPGGVVGATLGGMLVGMFSTVGTIILVTTVCAAALSWAPSTPSSSCARWPGPERACSASACRSPPSPSGSSRRWPTASVRCAPPRTRRRRTPSSRRSRRRRPSWRRPSARSPRPRPPRPS